jgi:putative transcriptional regulator
MGGISPDVDFLQGKLIVSSPSLNDPNFRKTVVLIAHHDEEGALGLVLSRPSGVTASVAVPVLGGLPGFMPADAEPGDLAIKRLRLFVGYSGWGSGQLEDELEEDSWIVVDAVAGDAFADDPDDLWRTVLQRKGGAFSLMENMPFDPGLN